VANSRRFSNIIILTIIVFLCLVVITVSFRGSGIIKKIKAETVDIFEPVQEKAFSFFNPVVMLFKSISDYTGLRGKNIELEEENADLRAKYAENVDIRVENNALRELLGLDVRKEHDLITVKAIGFFNDTWQSEIILNAGSADGVREGMGVMGSRGMVGIITSTGNKSSRVKLINDPVSSLGARVLSSRKLGIIEGSQEGVIYFKYISSEEEIYKGDILVTTEHGLHLPSDLLIGRVSSVKNIPENPYLEITVEPFEDFRSLEYLVVIKD
jgi:rod shape-determining protein MreC